MPKKGAPKKKLHPGATHKDFQKKTRRLKYFSPAPVYIGKEPTRELRSSSINPCGETAAP
jgi:hypothetical protein